MKIKEIKIVNQDQSTEIANIGADAINVDYNDTTVKAELDKLNNNVDINTTNISSEIATRANAITNLQSQINGLASGSPLVASSVSGMTDTSKVYVNTTDGYWYYYNGSSWVSGGVYQATEIENEHITAKKTNFIESVENILNYEDGRVVVKDGYCITKDNIPEGSANNNFSFIICPVEPNTQYTFKGLFYYLELDENKNLVKYYTYDWTLADRTIKTKSSTKFIAFNTKPNVSRNSMVVKGNNYPSEFYSYGNYYYFKGIPVYAKLEDLKNEVYTVGPTGDYSTFTECIRDLKNNTNKKTIYIQEGTYNIFNEIGGSEFALSIEAGTSFIDISDFIPPNTHVIGLGKVIFNFMPTKEEIGNIASILLSPINVMGSCIIENITINADNCRYCIHDETADIAEFDGNTKIFKNVKCYKYKSGGVGYNQAYANGFNKHYTAVFDNCYFESDIEAMSFHDRNQNCNSITINNTICKCRSTSPNAISLRFGNVKYGQIHQKVYINNSRFSHRIFITPENGNETINSFDLTLIGCGNVDVQIHEKLSTNIYEPKIYS